MNKRRIAIVTPWYGPQCTGGAETHARELACHLAERDEITVLTTCSASFLSVWEENVHPPGAYNEDGYRVTRFPVDPRNRAAFDDANARLLALRPDEYTRLGGDLGSYGRTFVEQSINSVALERHLAETTSYEAVIFLPYLYGVVVNGVEACAERAFLMPCLHDEVYARIPRIRAMVHRVTGILFIGEGEAELALRLFGPGVLHKSTVVGGGVEPSYRNGSVPRLPEGVESPYVLYLGRRDVTKNVDVLVEGFLQYRNRGCDRMRLVLAGPGAGTYEGDGILDLGFVDDATKTALLRGATALAQPSRNESYSRVVMEAWREEIPVAVNRRCLATAMAVERSGGGFLAAESDEWAAWFNRLGEYDATELREVGRRGAEYARENADWANVLERLRAAVGASSAASRSPAKTVHQIVQTLEYGDAISNYAVQVRRLLREGGYESEIFAESISPRMRGRGRLIDAAELARANVLIYHHSIGADVTRVVAGMRARKALVYHNITPAEFFLPYKPDFADLLSRGRAQLRTDVLGFDRYVADSTYNAQELRANGVAEVEVIPVVLDFAHLDRMPARMRSRGEAGIRWLFVGRVAPNKGLRRLLETLDAYLGVDSGVHLTIVGRYDDDDPYYAELRSFVRRRVLDRHVTFAGVLDDGELLAQYEGSDLYVSLSEHEGFCVPLVEAMFFDLPIITAATTAIPETMGIGGMLISDDATTAEIAALALIVRTDASLRERIIDAQRQRRQDFMPGVAASRIRRLAAEMTR